MLKRLFRLLTGRCPHAWKDTRINPWFIVTEQTCRICGEQRHHFMEDRRGELGLGEPAWRNGPHPGELP